jgi:hypothetical protein
MFLTWIIRPIIRHARFKLRFFVAFGLGMMAGIPVGTFLVTGDMSQLRAIAGNFFFSGW